MRPNPILQLRDDMGTLRSTLPFLMNGQGCQLIGVFWLTISSGCDSTDRHTLDRASEDGASRLETEDVATAANQPAETSQDAAAGCGCEHQSIGIK